MMWTQLVLLVTFGLPEILLFNCSSSSLPVTEFYSNVSSYYSKKNKCIRSWTSSKYIWLRKKNIYIYIFWQVYRHLTDEKCYQTRNLTLPFKYCTTRWDVCDLWFCHMVPFKSIKTPRFPLFSYREPCKIVVVLIGWSKSWKRGRDSRFCIMDELLSITALRPQCLRYPGTQQQSNEPQQPGKGWLWLSTWVTIW